MLSNRPLNPEKSKMSPLQAWVILEQAAGVAVCTSVSEPTLTREKNIGRPGRRRPSDSQSVGAGGGGGGCHFDFIALLKSPRPSTSSQWLSLRLCSDFVVPIPPPQSRPFLSTSPGASWQVHASQTDHP